MLTLAKARMVRAGLSILEVVIAAGILAAAALPFIHSILISGTSLTASLEEVAATLEATRVMTILQRLPWEELPVTRDSEPVPDTAWNDERFAWPEAAPARTERSPAAVLAELGPPADPAAPRRFLNITLVPLGSREGEREIYLKLVDVRVAWKRPGAEDGDVSFVTLCTLLRP